VVNTAYSVHFFFQGALDAIIRTLKVDAFPKCELSISSLHFGNAAAVAQTCFSFAFVAVSWPMDSLDACNIDTAMRLTCSAFMRSGELCVKHDKPASFDPTVHLSRDTPEFMAPSGSLH